MQPHIQNRDDIARPDWLTLALTLCCAAYGWVLIYAATARLDDTSYLTVQAIAIAVGLVGYLVCTRVPLAFVQRGWRWMLCLNLLLQALLLAFGVASGTNRSWLRFFGVGIQPAELGKVLFLCTFCAHLTQTQHQYRKFSTLCGLLTHAGLLTATVYLTSNDLGMTLVYAVLTLVLLFAAGVPFRWFALLGMLGAVGVPLVFSHLADYQRTRILVLFDPTLDAATYYQTQQSKIALGAGGLFGQGLLGGTQTQYGLLPASHTDFIFAVAGESFGLVGCLVIVGLLLVLVLRLFYCALCAPTRFAALLSIGAGAMILVQAAENIAMCLGLFPVMGLTLPLFSYGGSSVVAIFLATGLGQRRKYKNHKP